MIKISTSRDAYALVDIALARVLAGFANDQDMKDLIKASKLVDDLVMDGSDKALLIKILLRTFDLVAQDISRQE